ncbi:MAG: rhomboid family intramembrane serine protease, partial [Opitutaceae bacterium]
RPLTALFLHADGAHLCGNIVAGVFVFATVLPIFGRGRGWLLIALASILANFAAAAASYSQPYRSLGASTAVFAGLGLLTGAAIRQVVAGQKSRLWRQVMVPLAASLGLLALFGSGGLHTDLTAHLMGLASGIAFGWFGRRS